MKKIVPASFLVLLTLMAFKQQNNEHVIKGKLKRIVHYLSGKFTDYVYDKEGRLLTVFEPYGVKRNYTYSANLVFIEEIDPRYTKPDYDTLILKNYGLVDSVLSERSVWSYEYDLYGNVLEGNYMRTKGAERKGTKDKYSYFYEYYPEEIDSAHALLFGCQCEGNTVKHLLKKMIGVNSTGDTSIYFTYSYKLNDEGKVKKRMKYYHTGQLYDSLGYIYY